RKGAPRPVEHARLVRGEGDVREVTLMESFLEDAHGAIFGSALVLHDVTEERRLERDLRQAQRFESLGRLAGGIAHDFNNMLAPIMGYAQITSRDLDEDDPMAKNLEIIMSAAEKAVGLTRRLLALGRPQALSRKPFDVAEIVEEMRPLVERVVAEDVRISF